MGPIEYVEFAYDEHENCENFAWVVFKYPCSVEDSIKLLRGTKLYGMPIVTKNYSKNLEDPVFHDQLNYFKQLINVERSTQSNNGNTSRWNDQNLDNKTIIPDSLPEPPMSGKYNSNQDNYGHKSGSSSRHNYNDNSVSSKYQRINSYTKGRKLNYDSEDNHSESHCSRKKMEHNNSFESMSINDRDSYRKHRGYNSQTSSSWNESNKYQREQSYINENNSVKDGSVCGLRDTISQKSDFSDSVHPNDTNRNIACTSLLDFRDIMYHSKSNKYKDIDQHHSNFNSRNSERNNDTRGGNSFIHKQSRKNYSFESDRCNESSINYKNNYADEEYNDQNYSQDKSNDISQEYDNKYSNNYNDSLSYEKNNSNNYKCKQTRNQNMPSSSRQHNSYNPYKHNDEGHERKEYKNTYNELSGLSRGKNYNKGSFDRSRQNYYS